MNILILHGPNLNLLGEREVEVYGKLTLDEINSEIEKFSKERGVEVKIFQSNHEGRLIDLIHEHRKWAGGIVINPAGFTHYSYSLRDAIKAVEIPAVEVHISDIYQREEFRKISVIRDVCIKQISAKGLNSYLEGIAEIIRLVANKKLKK